MKRVLLTFPFVLIIALLAYRQFYLKPEIGDFRLLDLAWHAYCDFYKNEDDQAAGRAVFAASSKISDQKIVAHIDGEMQFFSHFSKVSKERQEKWVTHGNDNYSISFDIIDHSDVVEIQRYSGSMNVRRKGVSTTIPVIGRCSA